MAILESTQKEYSIVKEYESKPAKILALKPQVPSGHWEEIQIGTHTFLVKDHDPFPTWVGTLCPKCQENIYAHLELRKWVPGSPYIVNTPFDTLLCPQDWLVVDGPGNLTITTEKALLGAYKPV